MHARRARRAPVLRSEKGVVEMPEDGKLSRRSLLKRAGAVSLGAISARGLYGALDELGIAGPERAAAATVRRSQEQYQDQNELNQFRYRMHPG